MNEITLTRASETDVKLALAARVVDAEAALRALVLSIEALADEEAWGGVDEILWPAYEHARALLGVPVVMRPGGHENAHFHFLKDAGETCYLCEEEITR